MFDKIFDTKLGIKPLTKGLSEVNKLISTGWSDKDVADFIYKSLNSGLSDEEVADILYKNTKRYGSLKNALSFVTKISRV